MRNKLQAPCNSDSLDISVGKFRKKFTIKELAYDYKKANKDVLRQLSSSSRLTRKV